MNKKLVLILTLLSLTTAIRACEKDLVTFGRTSTVGTQSTDQYLFDEAKKEIEANYPKGVDVMASLSHKGFEPAQKLYQQIRIFEENKTKYNQYLSTCDAYDVMTNLSLEGFIPVRSFLEKIDRLQSIQLIPNDGERKIKVTKILQALSNEGFACAQVRVAFALMHESDSLCIAKDEKKGLALLQESALQQQYFACFMLGKRYWDGLSGNPKDKNEAVRFMRMATNLGRDFLEAYLT